MKMTKTMTKIIFEFVPSPDYMRVHLNKEISNSRVESFCRPLNDSSQKYLEKLGPLGKSLILKFFLINGITEITIEPYELRFEKGKAFLWTEELIPQIKAVLNELGIFEEEVDKESMSTKSLVKKLLLTEINIFFQQLRLKAAELLKKISKK